MADTTPSTPLGVPEHESCNTPVIHAFAAFLGTLGFAVEAERDVGGLRSGDTAYDHWLREAELAWERTSRDALAVFETEALQPSDQPLRQTAMLIRHALASESHDDFVSVQAMLDAEPLTFMAMGTSPLACRVNEMIGTAIGRLDQIGAMSMILNDPELDDPSSWSA